MAQKTTLFVFFVRASGGPEVTSISSPKSWINRARQAAKAPDAEVILIEQADWEAPDLTSFEDSYLRNNFPAIVTGIRKALIARGVPPIAPEKLAEDMEVMGSALTRLLVCVVKYTGELSPSSKPMAQDSPENKESSGLAFGTHSKAQEPVREMAYFEVVRPNGDGLCSDDNCPCGTPGARIRRGEGYLVISEEVVKFRFDARSIEEGRAKAEKMIAQGHVFPSRGKGVVTPILCCERSPKLKGLDREVAAKDAERWWKTGLAPLRATPGI